ncbi:GDSL-type esterase/lipase family protein [Maribacter sp. CXY002]|uniref:GDSL-type esterase/lipase family protein n=1 Tax=Maribacter luteocoastalis TaxID=3407671 RepID=UPI003B67CB40
MKKDRLWPIISLCTLIIFFLFMHKEELVQKYIRFDKKAEIVMFGDSHVAHGKWNSTLQSKAVLRYGWPGFTSENLVQKINDILLFKPKFVFILCGGNDIFHKDFNPYKTLSNQMKIATKLKQQNIEPVFLELIHQRGDISFNLNIDSINTILRAYCLNTQIEIIKMNPIMYDSLGLKATLTTDGLHLNSRGYEILSEKINQYLKNKFE